MLFIFGFLFLPLIALYLIYEKGRSIVYLKKRRKSRIYAIIDFVLLLVLAPFNAFYILCYWIFVTSLHENLSSNILKVTEIFQDDFVNINQK